MGGKVTLIWFVVFYVFKNQFIKKKGILFFLNKINKYFCKMIITFYKLN